MHSLAQTLKMNADEFFMSLVDDCSVFNYYPWGSEVFHSAFNNLHMVYLKAKYANQLKKPTEKIG